MIFFENNLLLQSYVVFDSESNGRNFSSLVPSGGEKKNIFNFFFLNDVTSRCRRFLQILKKNENNARECQRMPDGARELNLRPFDSELKTESHCSKRLFSKKIHPSHLLFILPVDI